MKAVIDKNSGFCIGVIQAIHTAESFLSTHKQLYCLGDIVHNNEEVHRLTDLGLVVIDAQQYRQLHNTHVLIRAHGEPPDTYEIAKQNNITLIDATCKVVLNLQKNIKNSYHSLSGQQNQILIFGKKGHAEVVGLIGQTEQNGIVISSSSDLDKIDYDKPAHLYSQTTQSVEEYDALINIIKNKYAEHHHPELFSYHDTICRSVANRSKQIQKFAGLYDTIIFVSGEKSSNGLYLYDLCKKNNSSCFFISNIQQLADIDLSNAANIGICGATSTPMWLMQQVKEWIEHNTEQTKS